MKRNFLLLMLLVNLASFAAAQRLPEIAVPENYKLSFTPDFTQDNFAGEETIQIHVLKATAQIVLNSAEINFQSASILSNGKTQTAQVTLDATREMATLAVAQALQPGPATLQIRYTGTLNNQLRGFYLGKDDHGRKYGATQFEATDARRAFPSFDEPAYKATFDVTVTAPQEMTVISNTKVISDSPDASGGKHTVKFATSPKMSSYLVALIVGQFDYVEGSAEGIPIRVYSTAGKKELGNYALKSAQALLSYYNQYFDIKYPYGKLDLIALPDFSAGAMENTACITYRENALLLDEPHASANQRRGVAGVIAHEMAHQWFGDLVTMKWWNDIWLNEGFATWMSSKPFESLHPEWNIGLDKVLGTVEALNVDSLSNTRPIRQEAETPVEIGGLFDGIAYGKAAAVLRMVEAYLGPEEFRAGVNAYLKEHANGNATAEDFWGTLARVSNKPVDAIMASYVNQPGAPIVNVKTKCVDHNTTVTLTQERYFYDRTRYYEGNAQLWSIPVCLKLGGATDRAAEKCELLSKSEQEVALPGCGSWVLSNAGAPGDYRSSYPPQALQALAHDIETALTPAERIMLLADTWASVRIGRAPIGDYLSLAEGLQAERTRSVIQQLLAQVDYIGTYLVNDSDHPTYQAWVRQRLGPLAKEVGFSPKPEENDDQKNLRAVVLLTLGRTGADPEVLSEARKQAMQALENPAVVSPELIPVFLNLAARSGDVQFYDALLAKIKAANMPEVYYRYLNALAEFTDAKLVQRTLDYAVSSNVRSQDRTGLISKVMQNPAAREIAWNFVQTHWDEISRGGGQFRGGDLIAAAGTFCTAEQQDQVQSFFSSQPTRTPARLLKQSIERINYCVDLKTRQEDALSAWLGSHTDEEGQ